MGFYDLGGYFERDQRIGPDASMAIPAVLEREKKWKRVFSIYGMSLTVAAQAGYYDPKEARTTEKGRLWLSQKVTGQSPSEVDWGAVVIDAGRELADGARAISSTVGGVVGEGVGAAAGGASAGAAAGLFDQFLKNPFGLGLAGLGLWAWFRKKPRRR